MEFNSNFLVGIITAAVTYFVAVQQSNSAGSKHQDDQTNWVHRLVKVAVKPSGKFSEKQVNEIISCIRPVKHVGVTSDFGERIVFWLLYVIIYIFTSLFVSTISSFPGSVQFYWIWAYISPILDSILIIELLLGGLSILFSDILDDGFATFTNNAFDYCKKYQHSPKVHATEFRLIANVLLKYHWENMNFNPGLFTSVFGT